ncbi:hypothetical protein FHW67_001970 [Herbaspirillum sp. Sphag1AN]|uniref:cellulose synthase n=1 Tax=unclassified Herbaspirillum TaxID=2624150 RepID=UPI001608CEB4|nr:MULTISPECIES: cellulose synthase [unclassified Herbaspirillum]MBB3212687.1 hypothetical protein [Herbaspirillum sp. Sphag1AN]MBB3245884.1 hypothetical protein [Herbaspirillum sp. Sphag64]
MDQKHHITIAGIKVIEYKSKRTGLPEQMKFAQCVVTSSDEVKGEQVLVGELILPKHLHDAPKGEYLAEFELSVGQDLRIGARLVHLHPVNMSARPSPTASKPAAAPRS